MASSISTRANHLKGSRKRNSGKDLITGTWVAQTSSGEQNFLTAIAQGDNFRDGQIQSITATYLPKINRDGSPKINKLGFGKAILFDDSDADGVRNKGERRLGTMSANFNALDKLSIADSSSGLAVASGYFELGTNNGKFSISTYAGDLLAKGRFNRSILEVYLEPSPM